MLLSLPNPAKEPKPALNHATEALHVGINETPLESDDWIDYRLFPAPCALVADENLDSTLRGLGFGYRAGFITSSLGLLIEEHANPSIGEGTVDGTRDARGIKPFLKSLRQGDEWRQELIRLKGVGRKVADCIGLMSMDRVSGHPLPPNLKPPKSVIT